MKNYLIFTDANHMESLSFDSRISYMRILREGLKNCKTGTSVWNNSGFHIWNINPLDDMSLYIFDPLKHISKS